MKNYQAIARTWVFVAAWGLAITAVAQTPRKTPASIEDLQNSIKHDPSNPKLHVALGLAYWDHNDYPHAFVAFQQAVKVGPASAEAHNWLGVAVLEKADLPGAIAEFRKAVALDPKYARAYTNLGSALAKSGNVGAAVSAFEKALELDPDNLAAHMNLGVALREKGDADGALVHLWRVARSESRNAGVHYELGQTLRQSGDLIASQQAFERALSIDPELREGYYGLGVVLKQESASARRPKAPVVSPADDLYRSGKEAVARGDLSTAKQELVEALRADETHADAHNLLGFVLGQQGDLPGAVAQLERSVALQPDAAEAHHGAEEPRKQARSESAEEARQHPALTLQ